MLHDYSLMLSEADPAEIGKPLTREDFRYLSVSPDYFAAQLAAKKEAAAAERAAGVAAGAGGSGKVPDRLDVTAGNGKRKKLCSFEHKCLLSAHVKRSADNVRSKVNRLRALRIHHEELEN